MDLNGISKAIDKLIKAVGYKDACKIQEIYEGRVLQIPKKRESKELVKRLGKELADKLSNSELKGEILQIRSVFTHERHEALINDYLENHDKPDFYIDGLAIKYNYHSRTVYLILAKYKKASGLLFKYNRSMKRIKKDKALANIKVDERYVDRFRWIEDCM